MDAYMKILATRLWSHEDYLRNADLLFRSGIKPRVRVRMGRA